MPIDQIPIGPSYNTKQLFQYKKMGRPVFQKNIYPRKLKYCKN